MQLQQLLEAMIAYMGGDARRIQHFIKVHALAQLIGRQEQLNERTQFILEAAALTHDIGIKNGEAPVNAAVKRRSWRDRRQRQNCWQS
jgi:uncharacterized protein